MLETDLTVSLFSDEVYRKFDQERTALRALGVSPARASFAAARVAALFGEGEGWLDAPHWGAVMRSEVAPASSALADVARALGVAANIHDIETIGSLWSLLGTAESIMETGGDIRLARDPVTALNGYGSSHRPRPWAVTFASSTASSSSERGYAAADGVRLATTAAMLQTGRRLPVQAALEDVRSTLASI
jgi:hypothetical protein